MAAMLFMHKP